MSKVSDGRSVRVGLVGPKLKPKGVSDGQPVNIPVPIGRSVGVTLGKAQPLSGWWYKRLMTATSGFGQK